MSVIRFENRNKVADITPNIDDILNAIYPIGVIVCGAKPTVGIWEKVEGKFLLGSSSSHPAGNTGGEESHTLTIDEMPRHTHNLNPPVIVYGRASNNSMASFTSYTNDGWKGSDIMGNPILSTGGNQAHNNMPPYLSVDMWRRIA